MPVTETEAAAERKQLHVIEWEHLELWKFYPCALATSWTVRTALYPMSVVKSRLQLQKQNNVYRGMTHAFTTIVRQEGVSALYRGFWVTLPQLSASFIYSTVYEKLRNVFTTHTSITSLQLVSAVAGGAASVCTQFVFVPTDIVAQYMMIHNQSAAFTGGSGNAGVLDALKADGLRGRWTLGLRVIRAVYITDGLAGFYRGFLGSIIMYIPSSMVFWWSYYETLIRLKAFRASQVTGGRSEDLSSLPVAQQHLLPIQAVAGGIGGMTAALTTNPLEVLRIRIQVHRTGYMETLRRMVKFEGSRVFTKGLPPRLINNGIYSCLIITGYEVVKRACVLDEYQEAVVW